MIWWNVAALAIIAAPWHRPRPARTDGGERVAEHQVRVVQRPPGLLGPARAGAKVDLAVKSVLFKSAAAPRSD